MTPRLRVSSDKRSHAKADVVTLGVSVPLYVVGK
jgi:hypothetical protein